MTTEAPDTWYYNRRGEQVGPLSAENLRRFLTAGELKRDALVRNNPALPWQPISQSIFSDVDVAGAAPLKQQTHLGDRVWHYTRNGEKIGPVTKAEIEEKFAKQEISSDTHVWKEGMSEWTPILKAGFNTGAAEPPPLASHLIGNGVVWLIAFLPIIFAVISSLLIGIRQEIGFQILSGRENMVYIGQFIPNGLPLIFTWSMTSLACLIDEARLRKAGYSSEPINRIATIIVPAYLFMRAQVIKEPPYYAFVWLFSFVIALAL